MSGAARGERGSSLIEVVVSVGVFGIALLGLNGMLITTIRTSEMARDVSAARFLAEQRLDQIKRMRYQDGNRDAWLDTSDPCTDIDEVIAANFPDENYGAVDLLNGTRFTYRNCSAVRDIKSAGTLVARSDYPSTAQGNQDYQNNHEQYRRFRREVYIYSTASQTTRSVTNVRLDGPRADARDNLVVDTVTPDDQHPRSNYIKYILVRVKWRDGHGALHHVTLSTEKAFVVPAS